MSYIDLEKHLKNQLSIVSPLRVGGANDIVVVQLKKPMFGLREGDRAVAKSPNRTDEMTLGKIKREQHVLSLIKELGGHDAIVTYHGSLSYPYRKEQVPVLLMEEATGTIHDLITQEAPEGLSLERGDLILKRILSVMDYLNKLSLDPGMGVGLIYRDIKAQNIGIFKGEKIKLIDFGNVGYLKEHVDLSRPMCSSRGDHGTYEYLPYEQLSADGDWTMSQVNYMLACLAIELYTGSLPWYNMSSLKQKDQKNDPHYIDEVVDGLRDKIPAERCVALRQALDPDDRKRPKTVEDFLYALRIGQDADPGTTLLQQLTDALKRNAQPKGVATPIMDADAMMALYVEIKQYDPVAAQKAKELLHPHAQHDFKVVYDEIRALDRLPLAERLKRVRDPIYIEERLRYMLVYGNEFSFTADGKEIPFSVEPRVPLEDAVGFEKRLKRFRANSGDGSGKP